MTTSATVVTSDSDSFKPPKENIGARIPAAWAKQLDDLVSATGRKKTELINEAIARYLDLEMVTVADRITILEEKVARNHHQPTVDIEIIAPLNKRLDKLEDIMQAILNQLPNIKPEIKVVEKVSSTISDAERLGGITLTQLLEKFQLKYHSVKKEAEEKDIPFHLLVQEKTDWIKKRPEQKRGRWFPVENNVTTTVRSQYGTAPSNGFDSTTEQISKTTLTTS